MDISTMFFCCGCGAAWTSVAVGGWMKPGVMMDMGPGAAAGTNLPPMLASSETGTNCPWPTRGPPREPPRDPPRDPGPRDPGPRVALGTEAKAATGAGAGPGACWTNPGAVVT